MSRKARRRWSQRVTAESHALALEPGVFTLDDPYEIARALQRSAERSTARKSPPFRSAMSMLTLYINRAGTQLPAAQRARLEAAKDALRDLCGKRRGDDPFRPSSEATADRATARAHPPRTSGAPGRRRD